MKIISQSDLDRILEISNFQDTLSDRYLTSLGNAQTSFVLNKFFNNDTAKLGLLNLSYSIPFTVSNIVADYTGNPISQIDIDLKRWVMSLIWGGTSVFSLRKTEGDIKIDYVSPDAYINDGGGQERILSFIEVGEDTETIQYILEQTYIPGRIENRLYRRDIHIQNDGLQGDIVPLSTIQQTSSLLDVEQTGLTINPLVAVQNTMIDSSVYGISELSLIRSLITSIEVEVVNIQDQFLKHLQAKLAVPSSSFPQGDKGSMDVKDLEVLAMEAGDTMPQYITNTNPIIDLAFKQIDEFITRIATTLSIPVEFFGIKSTAGGAEAQGTKIIKISPFIKKIDNVRNKFGIALRDMQTIIEEWTGSTDENFKVTWDSIFPIDRTQLANELKVARETGLISQDRAIMQYLNIDEEEAIAEKEKIVI